MVRFSLISPPETPGNRLTKQSLQSGGKRFSAAAHDEDEEAMAPSEYRTFNGQVLKDTSKKVARAGGELGKAVAMDMVAAPVNVTRTLANTAALPRLDGKPGIIGAEGNHAGCGFCAGIVFFIN